MVKVITEETLWVLQFWLSHFSMCSLSHGVYHGLSLIDGRRRIRCNKIWLVYFFFITSSILCLYVLLPSGLSTWFGVSYLVIILAHLKIYFFHMADFLILFFTEALFYCGVGVFLLLVDQTRKPTAIDPTEYYENLSPQIGQRISSVAMLVLSLIIPMVTMGFVWPWTGPAASAALAPYLVGIVVQFAFEQYAKYRKSPSLSVIPIIFQVNAISIHVDWICFANEL